MSGVVRRRVMNKPEEKGPIINTYKYSKSIDANSGSSINTYNFPFKLGASYTFNVSFIGTCSYVKIQLSNSRISSDKMWNGTGSYTYTHNTMLQYNNFTIYLWKPSAGTFNVTLTETIPRT